MNVRNLILLWTGTILIVIAVTGGPAGWRNLLWIPGTALVITAWIRHTDRRPR